MYNFLMYCFYLFTIFPIFFELAFITEPKYWQNIYFNFKNPNFPKTNKYHLFGTFHLGYIFWNLIGIFSSQWILFLLIFCFGMIPKSNINTRYIDVILTLFVLVFIILNKFHFKIDLATKFYSLL